MQGTVGKWIRCKTEIAYKKDIRSSVPYHKNISIEGYRSLVFRSVHNFNLCLLLKYTIHLYFLYKLQLLINISTFMVKQW